MRITVRPDEIPAMRTWQGERLSPVEEVLMYHDETGPVPETFRRLTVVLEREGIGFVVIGALALAAHKFRRATEDVGLCVREADLRKFRQRLVGTEYQEVEGRRRRFYDPETQVTIDLLVSGELAGRSARNKGIRFPDPDEGALIGGIHTVGLSRLIELKLVTWRFRDWADVVSLIRANALVEDFAEQLDPLVRMAYLECYDQMLDEERYDPERYDAPSAGGST